MRKGSMKGVVGGLHPSWHSPGSHPEPLAQALRPLFATR